MTDIIAWAALLFSGISLILSIRTKRAQDKLRNRQIEAHEREAEEAQRANIIAHISKEGSWAGKATSWKLVIENRGPADATDVDLRFVGEQQLVSPSELSEKLPMSVLAPGEDVRLIASPAMGQPSKYDIILKWRDSDPRKVQRILTI